MSSDSRFPVHEAPDSHIFQQMEQSLTIMHRGRPPFQWEDQGQLLGCYAPLAYSQPMVEPFFQAAKAAYQPSVLNGRYRELAVLGLCSVYDAPYVVYCHRGVGAKVGLTTEQYNTGLAGNVPEGLTPGEAAAYKLGRAMTSMTGPLDDDTWKETTAHLSKSDVAGIAHIIGGYKWVATFVLINDDHQRWRDAMQQ